MFLVKYQDKVDNIFVIISSVIVLVLSFITFMIMVKVQICQRVVLSKSNIYILTTQDHIIVDKE